MRYLILLLLLSGCGALREWRLSGGDFGYNDYSRNRYHLRLDIEKVEHNQGDALTKQYEFIRQYKFRKDYEFIVGPYLNGK